MPVREIAPHRSSEHAVLVDALAAEWHNPQPGNAEPVIAVERGRDNRVNHVYVVWSRWADVDRVQRSEIIMDAAERHLPPDEVLNITIAMGLTADEASRMGLSI